MITYKKYPVIYADPPWRFAAYSEKGEGRSAIAHYDCMNMKELCALPVSDIAEKDCVLFLWTTDPFLAHGLELIRAWGFEFKTVAFYWAKLKRNAVSGSLSEDDFFTGVGYWTRANIEPCLLATRGHPKRISKKVRRLILAPRREHSRKPDETYDRIQKLIDGPYIELFARASRDCESWATSPPYLTWVTLQRGGFRLISKNTRGASSISSRWTRAMIARPKTNPSLLLEYYGAGPGLIS
jgi:N6-adenosine-specific RNA methylase IME4